MKKIFATTLVILAVSGLMACNDKTDTAETTGTNTVETTISTVETTAVAVG